MAESLFESEKRDMLISSLREKPRILAFDFDGTLVPLAAAPEDVTVSDSLKNELIRIASDKQMLLSVVSGRTVENIESLIGIPSIIYFGNHGITSSAEGFGADKKNIENWTGKALHIWNEVKHLPGSHPGCIVENKGPVISIHYRNVSPESADAVKKAALETAARFGADIQTGKMVIELMPVTDINKGTALSVLALKGNIGWQTGDTFLFAGDDETDEYGFIITGSFGEKAVSIKTGKGRTKAKLRISQPQVLQLLKMI